MLDALYKLLVIAVLAFSMYIAYHSRVFLPGEEINLKKDFVIGIIFILLLFITRYVYTLLNG